jgi:A/G-specific adenine glycosylase
VKRVLSRLRIIGAEINTKETHRIFLSIANAVVDPDRPGDFNQALMELGALICTPRAPKCSDCPVKTICKAYARQKKHGKKIRDENRRCFS